MRGLALAALAAAACTSDPRPAVVIASAPLVVAPEGEPTERPIAVAPLPRDPLVAADFTIVADGDGDGGFDADGDGRFAELAIAGSPGALVVRLVPRCDAAAPSTEVVAALRVEALDGAVAPARLAVQIVDRRGAACAPQVTAWIGDACDAAPAPPSPVPVLAIAAGDPSLCVKVVDPGGEPLWVRARTDAPAALIPTLGLDRDQTAGLVAAVPLGAIAAGAPDDVLGRFELAIDVHRAPPPAVADTQARIALELGAPGTAIEVTAAPAAAVEEFATGTVEASVWSWLGTGTPDDGLAPCLRAVRTAAPTSPIPRRVPFLSVADVERGGAIDSGGAAASPWLCGRRFRIAMSPPIDAAAVETVRLEAGRCACGPPVTAPAAAVGRDLAVAITDVANELACLTSDDATRAALIACADLDGDGAREILFQAHRGPCLYGGARPAPLPFDPAELLALHAFSVRSAAGPVHHVVAAVSPSPPGCPSAACELRRDATTGTWAWVDYPPLDNVPPQLLPFARDPTGGATHLIARTPLTTQLRAQCVVAGCADHVVIPNALQPGDLLAGLGAADLDGDGAPELVVATARDDGPGLLLGLRFYGVSWSGTSPTFTEAVPARPLPRLFISGNEMVTAAARPDCVGGPCPRELLAIAVPGSSVVYLIYLRADAQDLTGVGVRTMPVPSPIRDLTRLDGRLVATLDLGLRRASLSPPLMIAPPDIASWTLIDPFDAENRTFTGLEPPDPGFGAALGACHGGGAAAFASSFGSVRITRVAGAGP